MCVVDKRKRRRKTRTGLGTGSVLVRVESERTDRRWLRLSCREREVWNSVARKRVLKDSERGRGGERRTAMRFEFGGMQGRSIRRERKANLLRNEVRKGIARKRSRTRRVKESRM